MSESAYNGKTLDQLSDAECLELSGNLGPGIIGQELFDRANKIRTTTDNGKFGPALLDPFYGRPADQVKAALDADEPEWDDLSRADAAALADTHNVSYRARATRAQIVAALIAVGVKPAVRNPEATE